MTWPEAFVAVVAIIAFAALGIGFFWMLAHTTPRESQSDAILRRNADMPMRWTYRSDPPPMREPSWVVMRRVKPKQVEE